MIIGEDVLPVDIEANTTRLCRIKNSARRSISTLEEKDRILNTWTFQTTDQMTKKLNELAEIPDSEIKFVDILLPVQMLKVSLFFFSFINVNYIKIVIKLKMQKDFKMLAF